MSRYFTRPEAEKLLPEIDKCLRDIAELKKTHDAADDELKRLNSRITMMGGTNVHTGDFMRLRSTRDTAGSGLKDAVERLQSYGCLLKDFEMGLVDFPTMYRGEEVYLCWKQAWFCERAAEKRHLGFCMTWWMSGRRRSWRLIGPRLNLPLPPSPASDRA